MADQHYWIKLGDLQPPIIDTLYDGNGAVLDLSGAGTKVRFHLATLPSGGTSLVNALASILTPTTAGQVQYAWQAGNLTATGTFFGEWPVSFDSGISWETFPTTDYLFVHVVSRVLSLP